MWSDMRRDSAGRLAFDPAEFVGRLRWEFPNWAVLHDPFAEVWYGLYHDVTVHADSGIALRDQILTSQVSAPQGRR
jgi:hypothetical protein